MIVLDTNVLSELMRVRPDSAVVAWVDRHPRAELAITAVTVAELMYGIATVPAGARKDRLVAGAGHLIDTFSGGRILAFDQRAALEYALIVADRQRAGKPISMADAQIAAICHATNASLATRNTRDFADIGLTLIDPWLETSGR